jgi:hypothetical protein
MRKVRLTLAAAAALIALAGMLSPSAAAADIPITAPAPVWHQATCTSGGFGSVDIPQVTGLVYNLDGTWPAPGSTQLLSTYPSPHEVMAAAFDGYVLIGGPVIRWDFTVTVPTDCGTTHGHCPKRLPAHAKAYGVRHRCRL